MLKDLYDKLPQSNPILEGEDLEEFWRKIDQGLEEQYIVVPTPDLWKAEELIRNNKNGGIE